MTGFFLFFFGFIVWFLISLPKALESRKEVLRRREKVGNGTYCRLEYQLFCKYRDELFEEHEDEVNLLYTNIGDYVQPRQFAKRHPDPKQRLLYQALEKAQAEITARGYKPCLKDGFVPAYKIYNEQTVYGLRVHCEGIDDTYGNKNIPNIEKDRDPWEVFGTNYEDYAKKFGYPSVEEIDDNGRYHYMANYPEYQKYIKGHRWSDNPLMCR